jgi:hypothetical protein
MNSTRKLAMAAALVAACLTQLSCGTNAVDAATACAGRDLVNICPIGTSPRLDAEATSQCSGSAGVRVVTQSGEVEGACASVGGCTVFCEPSPTMECPFGIETISRDGIVCRDQPLTAGCGNGVCDGGENSQTCQIDCSGVCVNGSERCNGSSREVCNLMGRWETLECVESERCIEYGQDQTGCVASTVVAQTTGMFHVNGAIVPQPTNGQQVQPHVVQQPVETAQPRVSTGAQGAHTCDGSTFECAGLSTGFRPNPMQIVGYSGGPARVDFCAGYFAGRQDSDELGQPDHVLYLYNDFTRLNVQVYQADGPTSLLVASLDNGGALYCSQPGDGTNPILSRSMRAGTYGIWVGSQQAENYDYRLRLSE